jgi:hypothetical protein
MEALGILVMVSIWVVGFGGVVVVDFAVTRWWRNIGDVEVDLGVYRWRRNVRDAQPRDATPPEPVGVVGGCLGTLYVTALFAVSGWAGTAIANS